MTRKEKKALAQQKRSDIMIELCDFVDDSINQGYGTRESLEKLPRWLLNHTRKNPQEKHLYEECMVNFCNGLLKDVKQETGR